MATPWLVIPADRSDAGRGVRGYALAWFLRTYFGRRQVAIQKPAEARSSPIEAETVFVGMPSSLDPDELQTLAQRTRCRRIVPFDYLDRHEPAWSPEQAAALQTRANLYLKPWSEQAWRDGLRHGHLPLRLRSLLGIAVTQDRMRRQIRGARRHTHDVSFFGRPNFTHYVRPDGAMEICDTRVAWLRELRQHAPELSFNGGFTHCDDGTSPEAREFCLPQQTVSFFAYWRAMGASRVLLAPGGNVPWTYRHYECLYAGGVVVTVDYRERDMLIPLPIDEMVHVPDGAPAPPHIREALARAKADPAHARRTYAHLDRFLVRGAYSRRRPELVERFIKQLG